jgi:hypothetical protein
VTARRALTPAARGVSLAVLAALRGGRVDLADQADGSTLATSTAPDGTELLRAVLRLPVRGHDPRQLTLPAVAPVPVPAEVPPAPVATPAGEVADAEAPAPQAPPRDEHHGIAVGDVVELDGEAFLAHVSDEFGWQGFAVETTRAGRPVAAVQCLWGEIERVGDRAWRTRPTKSTTRQTIDDGPPVSKGAKKAAKPKAPEPAAEDTETARINGLAAGDVVTLDDELVEVMGLDTEGWTWRTVGDDPRTRDEGECLWSEVEHVERNRWRVLPVRTDETPAQQREAARPKRARAKAKAAKARPARLTPEPEADALTRHGQRCVVAMLHSGGPWELVWSDELPGQMTHDVAWRSVEEQAHRARRYDRGGHCAADTRDGAK